MLINVKMPTDCWHFNIYKQDKFCAQLSWAWKKINNLVAWSMDTAITLVFWTLLLNCSSGLGQWSVLWSFGLHKNSGPHEYSGLGHYSGSLDQARTLGSMDLASTLVLWTSWELNYMSTLVLTSTLVLWTKLELWFYGLGQYSRLCPSHLYIVYMWASTRENMSWGFANNTGADQPVHLCRLISAFFKFYIRFWNESYLNLLQAKFQYSS